MSELTHLDAHGRAHMVDVSTKDVSARTAIATATISMQPETLGKIIEGGMPKGDVMAAARLAGIMAAKQTPQLIPLCHPLPLSSVSIQLTPDSVHNVIEITATCKVASQTGVEMEALTAVSVAALTVYDMCKAIDRGMVISNLRLLRKAGGKSGDWTAT